ncbi:MAG: hypothetical protein Q8K89_01010 [Actinomycetota bacterium]|nr:hypothetical protein [Actinomycetota bacterium]
MAEETSEVTYAPNPPNPPNPPVTGVAAPEPPHFRGSRGGGGMAWFGVVLVVIGFGLVMGRVAPGISFGGFWPASVMGLVFIVLGIRGMFWPLPHDDTRPNKIIEGLTGISVGIILISNSIGAVPWGVWWSVLSLWPVLLVSAGLDLIGKGLRSTWLRVLSSVVVLLALWYGAFVLPVTSASALLWRVGTVTTEPFEFTKPAVSGVRRADAHIVGPVGAMTLTDGDALVTASGKSAFGQPSFSTEIDGSRASVDIRTGQEGSAFLAAGGPRLDVELDRDVIWGLTIDSGLADLRADLKGIRLSALRVKSGASNAVLELGSRPDGDVPVQFDSGVSQLTVRLPRDVEARVEREVGLSNTEVDPDLNAVDGGWETDGYRDANNRYTIRLKSGISDFRIERY